MKITYTNGELAEIAAKLEAATAKDITMPPKVGYKIIKNKIAIKQALKPFELARNEIIKHKSGGKTSINYSDDPRAFEEVAEEINEISRESVTVEISPISLEDIPGVDVPISFIAALDFMIDAEEG